MKDSIQTIVTIGPASASRETLLSLIEEGVSCVRVNFSHGTHETNGALIELVREIADARNVRIPIIQDLSGPREQNESGHSFDAHKPEITEKDMNDLAFGISRGVEFIAQSYVGSAEDVNLLRRDVAALGGDARIIAKIERADALPHIEEIIEAADAIMVARGDLADSIPIEDLPFVERDIIARCKSMKKPVIVATGLLLSMVESERPARSEIVDIAYAVLSGADVLMLSDETARGAHPLEALRALKAEIARAVPEAAEIEHHYLLV